MNQILLLSLFDTAKLQRKPNSTIELSNVALSSLLRRYQRRTGGAGQERDSKEGELTKNRGWTGNLSLRLLRRCRLGWSILFKIDKRKKEYEVKLCRIATCKLSLVNCIVGRSFVVSPILFGSCCHTILILLSLTESLSFERSRLS